MSSEENADGKTEKRAEEIVSWSCWLRTMLAGSGSLILMIFTGIHQAQSSVILPQLKEEDSFIHVTPDQETWIASLGIIMAPVTSLIIGPILDSLGRKIGLQLFYLLTGLGYGVMSCAQEVFHIYIGRMICGLGAGLYVCSVVYMVEICTKKQREYIFAVTPAIVSTGITLGTIIGGYFPWQTAALTFSILSFILLVTQNFIPESPSWLFKTGQEGAAVQSLLTLGRSESAIRQELAVFKLSSKIQHETPHLDTFFEPTVWKPFVIMVAFFFLQSASGLYSLLFYSVDFVVRLGTTFNPLDVAVMLSVARLFACATIAVYFKANFGRKFSTAFSGFWMAASFLAAGTFVYIERGVAVPDRQFAWLPVVCLQVYVIATCIGMHNLPWLMSGEVYPPRVRGTMTSVTYVLANIFMFISVKSYFACVDALQIYGLLFVYAGFSLAAILLAAYVLPETLNKSLFEIEQGFLPKKKRQLDMDVQECTSNT